MICIVSALPAAGAVSPDKIEQLKRFQLLDQNYEFMGRRYYSLVDRDGKPFFNIGSIMGYRMLPEYTGSLPLENSRQALDASQMAQTLYFFLKNIEPEEGHYIDLDYTYKRLSVFECPPAEDVQLFGKTCSGAYYELHNNDIAMQYRYQNLFALKYSVMVQQENTFNETAYRALDRPPAVLPANKEQSDAYHRAALSFAVFDLTVDLNTLGLDFFDYQNSAAVSWPFALDFSGPSSGAHYTHVYATFNSYHYLNDTATGIGVWDLPLATYYATLSADSEFLYEQGTFSYIRGELALSPGGPHRLIAGASLTYGDRVEAENGGRALPGFTAGYALRARLEEGQDDDRLHSSLFLRISWVYNRPETVRLFAGDGEQNEVQFFVGFSMGRPDEKPPASTAPPVSTEPTAGSSSLSRNLISR